MPAAVAVSFVALHSLAWFVPWLLGRSSWIRFDSRGSTVFELKATHIGWVGLPSAELSIDDG